MADYMAYALELREHPRGRAAAGDRARSRGLPRARSREAAERDVPVIALKVGRTEGVEGDGDRALGRAGRRARRVRGAVRRVRRARGPHARRDGRHDGAVLGAAAGPGGPRHRERPRLRRRAGDVRRPRERPRRAVRGDLRRDAGARSQDALDPGLVAENPLDAWGTGIDADRIFRESFLLLHDDPDTAAVAFAVDLTRQGEPYDESYLGIVARRVRRHHEAVLRAVEPARARSRPRRPRSCASAGIPVLEGTASGPAGAAASARRGRRATAARERLRRSRSPDEVRDRWRARLGDGERVLRARGRSRLLADYGVPVVRRAGGVLAPTRPWPPPPSSAGRSC